MLFVRGGFNEAIHHKCAPLGRQFGFIDELHEIVGLDMSQLEARLSELKKVVRIEQGLTEAVAEAMSAAGPGDTVLFSPAYASFGMFKNEFDRGDQFVALVAKLA